MTFDQRVGGSEWAMEIPGREHSGKGTAREKVMMRK